MGVRSKILLLMVWTRFDQKLEIEGGCKARPGRKSRTGSKESWWGWLRSHSMESYKSVLNSEILLSIDWYHLPTLFVSPCHVTVGISLGWRQLPFFGSIRFPTWSNPVPTGRHFACQHIFKHLATERNEWASTDSNHYKILFMYQKSQFVQQDSTKN